MRHRTNCRGRSTNSSVTVTVDFAQWNGDVSGRTVGRSERRGTEAPDRSDVDGP